MRDHNSQEPVLLGQQRRLDRSSLRWIGCRSTCTKIGASGVWSTVSPGGAHTCGITTAKNLYCWGYNLDGRIGDGTSNNLRPLTKIAASGVWSAGECQR